MPTISKSVTVEDGGVYTVHLNIAPDGSTVTPVNDIQTWLHCGDIWDKDYTTLNQVLADNTTLLGLISSNNACDYLVRSTEWADMADNQTAMSYIGNNEYCAQTLLTDSVWRTSIVSSEYWESVLTTKVPAMTSNTEPSGECFILNGTQGGYKVFNGSDGTGYNVQKTGSSPGAIAAGYDFVTPIRVLKYRYHANGYNNSATAVAFTLKVQASNDKSTWADLYSRSCTISAKVAAGSTYEGTFDNSTKYRYYRIHVSGACMYITNDSNQKIYTAKIDSAQFYGR